jgi:hypothetical protein
MRNLLKVLVGAIGCIAALGLIGPSTQLQASEPLGPSAEPLASAEVLHTYGYPSGHEVVNLIAVNTSKLLPLIPDGYHIVPATSLGVGGGDQGIVAITSFQGADVTVDEREPTKGNLASISVSILVAKPAEAVQAGLNIPGAFHLYALATHTDDAQYAASLRSADMPVEFVDKIGYQRTMDDASGVGDLSVSVPSKNSPFKTFSSSEFGYAPATGALDGVFWYEGGKGKAALHFRLEPYLNGNALSRIYTEPKSKWDRLFTDGGLGSCASDPVSGYRCVIAPSLNLRYEEGGHGTLLLIE